MNARAVGGPIPLCIDLDGTFIRSDLLLEGVLRLIRYRPLLALRLPFWLLDGKANLKSRVAGALPESIAPPPVNAELAAWMGEEQAGGRPVLLVTASHSEALGSVRGLFPFDEIIASDHFTNLKGETKAALLVERFGERGFDYAGDSSADHAVWRRARKAVLVFHSRSRMERLGRKYDVARTFCTNSTGWRDWVKALRIHQWAKNLLIALPFLAGHHYHTLWQLAGLAASFLAMSLCASGTYLWNDLLDLEYDRAHPRKRQRLAASGRTSIQRIGIASVVMVASGLIGGFVIAPAFGLLLLGYIAATLSYSLYFKRIAIADIFMLAFLYLSRVIGGIVISEAVISFWLFAFTFLLFLSLAAAKRHVELAAKSGDDNTSLHGRGYRSADLPAVSALGIASGVASCIVLGLYSNSSQVTALYHRPEWIWGICVIALYWISRIWLVTHRGEMHEDPVVFALKDRGTWLLGLLSLLCAILAQPIAP